MADKPKFSFISKLGEGRVPSKNPIPYDLGELESFIQETAKVAQYHYGLGDVDLRVNYGKYVGGDNVEALAKSEGFASAKDYIKKRNTTNATHRHTNTENYIEMNLDVLWNQEIGKMKSKGLEGVPTIDEFKDSLKELVGHEFRHQWQHEGKTPEARELISKQAKYIKENPMSEIKDYNKKYEVYYNKPFEIDAREQGGYFKNNYEELSKKYKESIGSNTANATIDDFKRNTQKFFDESGASVEDIVNNFDSYFSQAMKETDFSKIDGKALMDYRNELKKSYDNRWTQEAERAAQEKIRQREIEIENKKKNAKASDTEYWNGQKKRDIMDLEDGIKAELFYGENGEVLVQKLIHPDGKRDISVRRTAEDLERFTPDELDGAKHQISKKRLIREGNIIEMSEIPDSMYAKNTTVDLGTGNVEIKHRLRDRPWGGGKQEEKIINSKLKTSNVNNETPKLNNNFRGNKNNRTPQEQFIDKIIGKQNPGKQTSRVFNYGGKEYAIYDNLEVNSKDLSKGFTGGRVVDLETNELINARDAFPEINQALMDGDLDTAFEKISSFEESKHTFAKSELDNKIVNKHTDNANTQTQSQQESREEQQNRTEKQHEKQENDFEDSRNEQRQQTKDNHKENKELHTENSDTSKTKTKTVDDIETEPIVKTKKQKLERTKGKKLVPGKTKVKSNLKVGKNVKGKDLRQILVNTTVSKALNTVEETVENAIETGTKTAMNYQKVNIIHPDRMDDFQIGDLSDEEFEQLKTLANGNQEKIDEWTERRNKARANKVLEHYTDQASGNYYSNSEFKNPYEYKMPNMEFEVDGDGKTTVNKTGGTHKVEVEGNKSFKRVTVENANKVSNSFDDIMDWMKSHKLGMLDIGMNVYGTISTYKESRRQGRSVLSSAVRAGADFAIYEMLGFWGSLGVGLAKSVPSLAIKGTSLLYKENRRMNSAANNQVFGGSQFQDTQQLATMRQSGMEMAKMAQYNLQQTLMGNEATHFHR